MPAGQLAGARLLLPLELVLAHEAARVLLHEASTDAHAPVCRLAVIRSMFWQFRQTKPALRLGRRRLQESGIVQTTVQSTHGMIVSRVAAPQRS